MFRKFMVGLVSDILVFVAAFSLLAFCGQLLCLLEPDWNLSASQSIAVMSFFALFSRSVRMTISRFFSHSSSTQGRFRQTDLRACAAYVLIFCAAYAATHLVPRLGFHRGWIWSFVGALTLFVIFGYLFPHSSEESGDAQAGRKS